MNTLKKIWEFWNGKKTVVGAVGLFLTYGAEGLGWLSPEIASALKAVFGSLGATGLVHKGIKLSR